MANQTNNLKEKLKEKLREIFQFESEDLDFGIYKIMNYKRKEIERFIEEELINEIKKQLALLSEEEGKEIEEKLKEISSKNGVKKYIEALQKGDEERARIYREDFAEDIEEYERLKRQLEEIKISEDLERQIYNHLINFFSRYYDNGDFISKRRYGKNEKYVVPYNGEEVLLYWVNKDQYYIKTTEYFRRYTFKVKELTVNFRVVEAEEEKGNVKAQEKKFFVLNERVFDLDQYARELNIYFEYRALTDEEKEIYGNRKVQEKINESIFETLKERLSDTFRDLFEIVDDEKEDYKKYLIGKHLYKYTRRNTTDYFIHKDLKGFLERELDFYIKNEFLQLEDLQVLEQSGYFDKLRLYLIGVRTFKNIALKIIEFLAQIENFQKKIWEKKKFVIDTNYVITLDKIKKYAGEEFLESILDEILSNEKQLEEWKDLFGIEIKSKNDLIERSTLQGKEWKKLPIDTKYFGEDFKWKLLVALSEKNDLDEILDGLLFKSENWQALNLLLNKYYEKVQSIYIDPPFNSPSTEILYKNDYKHASWLSLMENRINLGKKLLQKRGIFIVAIDENEQERLGMLLNEAFYNWEKTMVTVLHNPRGQQGKNFSLCNEYAYFIYPDNKNEYIKNIKRDEELIEELRDHGGSSLRTDAKNCFYPIIVKDGRIERIGDIPPEDYHPVSRNIQLEDGSIEIWPIDNNGIERKWTYSKDSIFKIFDKLLVKKKPDGTLDIYRIKTEKKPRTVWIGEKYDASVHGSQLLTKMGFEGMFTFPKSLYTVVDSLYITTDRDSTVLDFFAGSGTTAHAVMKLNKEDGGKRKFILVEMADYFDTVIIPRIKKVAYSFNWKEGKPQDTDGIGVFFKYHTLEQYEDALENIEFEDAQKMLYEFSDYFVKYMLEWETKNSKTFLKIDGLKDPFNYKLKIIENYQQKIVNVDLVETFNYLLGLYVRGYKVLNENGRKYVFVFGEKDEKRIAIVWRSIKDIDFERDKEVINSAISGFNPDEIYINGDALVKGFKPIEPLFKSLMFEEVRLK